MAAERLKWGGESAEAALATHRPTKGSEVDTPLENRRLFSANDVQTEQRRVKPVLAALGFASTVQAGLATATGRRQPDYALLLGDDRRAEADRLGGGARYGLAVAVADAKRFDRPLDGRGTGGENRDDPVTQIGDVQVPPGATNYMRVVARRPALTSRRIAAGERDYGHHFVSGWPAFHQRSNGGREGVLEASL